MKAIFLAAGLALVASAARAQDSTTARRDSAARLAAVNVTAERVPQGTVKPLQALTLPVSASVTAQRVAHTVNLVDAEDAVKYLPSVFLRKRNNGDTQATLGTRVWGVSSSARSLVFADGVPLSALIANNNAIGAPRWGLVAPSEIERIDLMYGPFSAAYAGNSMGAVVEITTRMPEQLLGSVAQTQAMQRFTLYGTSNDFHTSQTTADVGSRFGRFSFVASGNHQDSRSQPLAYVTSGTFPTGTTGGFAEQNKLGAAANVLGATGLQHTRMTNGKLKLAYDVTPTLRAAYTFGFWSNDANARTQTYIDRTSQPTFAGQAGFASGVYELEQRHVSHSLTLRTNTRRTWDFEAVAAHYEFDKDQQRAPASASASDTTFGSVGRVAVLDGTQWSSLDVKGAWRSERSLPKHVLTFGAHHDGYRLANPTYNTSEWRAGSATTVASVGNGKTQTQALWAQDAWRLTDMVSLTLGARAEWWRGYDGVNANGAVTVIQRDVERSAFSPKAVLAWTPTLDWSFTGSVGKAYRFATAAELYQLVTTGTTFTSPDPDLKPDNVLATELRARRTFSRGMAQVAVFQDDVHDAIISQFLPLVPNSPALYSFASNVDHVRARGVELAVGETDMLISGLELSGSATYVDAKTLALSGRASATAPAGSAIGKQLPNIPKWRANVAATYRPDMKLAFTVAGRYSGLVYTTLDNADVHPNTYQGFSEWFVADAHVHYAFDRHWSAAIGVDNLFDRKYFLFHPFPQRTFVANAKFSL
jgi:iron complex outermembrane receptor protein